MPFLDALRKAKLPPNYQDPFTLLKDVPPIIKAKVHLIEELHDRAMIHVGAVENASTASLDIDMYISLLSEKIEKITQKVKVRVAEIPDIDSSSRETNMEWIKVMGKPEYEPDPDLHNILLMLSGLWTYWSNWPYSRVITLAESDFEKGAPLGLAEWMSYKKGDSTKEDFYRGFIKAALHTESDFEAALDLSLAKLAHQVGVETANIRHWAKKKEAALRLNLNKRWKADGAILSAFKTVRKEPGDTLNRIVGRIFKHLNGKPSKSTIERRLKDNSELMRQCFREEKRNNKSRFIYIRHTGV